MSNNRPTHVILSYDRNDHACRVGVAWPLKSGDGFTLHIHPGVSIGHVDGSRIVITRAKERDDQGDDKRDGNRDQGGGNRDQGGGRGRGGDGGDTGRGYDGR